MLYPDTNKSLVSLNKKTDIRTEMGQRKEEQEKIWNTTTNTRQTAWTQAVRNRIRQKVGEIQVYHSYEKGEEKWHKEHMPRKGQGGISEEGQEILEDRDIWTHETTLRGVIYGSRKRERINDDGVFIRHQKGPITSTFTTDWFLREGEGRDLLGEWMKLTSVRSQDQRRMLQANSHTFPSNAWIHWITKKKESDRCDL